MCGILGMVTNQNRGPGPTAGQWLNPIFAAVPTQLVAYHRNVKRGIDPDFSRNLSRTLTVD